MNKKKVFSYLFIGLLAVGATGTVTSCKDYDDDISNLQSQIDANKKLIDQIQALIQSGSVITNVTQSSNGLAIALSNGKTYNLTNGKDGKDGAAGTAWTIGSDGFWYKDGSKTEFYALGTQGDKGDKGDKGDTGAKGDKGDKGDTGKAGADGAYYVPNEDGFFHKVENGKDTPTTISWKDAVLTGVMDGDYLTLTNVKYPDGTYKTVKISLSNNLRAISFITDAGVVNKDGTWSLNDETLVDGVEAIQIKQYSYKALKGSNLDKQSEAWAEDGNTKTINPTTYAYYKVEPAEASVEDLKQLVYRVTKSAKYISTRAAASSDFNVKAGEAEFKDGILRVPVEVTGVPATKENISLVSLQATKRNKEVVEQSDDPETIYKADAKDLLIARDAAYDYDYRNAIDAAKPKAFKGGHRMALWSTGINLTEAPTQENVDADTTVVYNGSVDLAAVAHEALDPHTTVDLNALGLSFKYELVKDYIIGSNKTNQADFASLNGSVLTPKVFTDTKEYAAVGRTPIVRVSLMHGNDVVKVAYIKVLITRDEVKPQDTQISFNMNDFQFVCGKEAKDTTTVEQINVQLYNVMEMDRDRFHNKYAVFDAQNGANGNVGTVTELKNTERGVTTYLLEWTLTNDEMWKNAGKEITHKVLYKTSAGATTGNVVITLKATVKGIATSFDVPSANFLKEYWNSAKTLAHFNVNVPNEGEKDNTKCVFKNDFNSIFVQDGQTGKIELPTKSKNVGADYDFFFYKTQPEMTVEGKKVTYTVTDTELKAKIGDGAEEVVARITNDNKKIPLNYVEVVKTSNVAKQLLNTGKWDVNYGAKSTLCEDANKVATITFNKKEYFTVRFLRPVDIASKAADNFKDAVDFGEKGSFIKLEDLIAPSDWRGRSFADYNNYWSYYGPFSITVDTKTAESNLNGSWHALESTIELTQNAEKTMGTGDNQKTSDYGFLTYKNNGSGTTGFKIRVKATVTYGWGDIKTDWIEISVAGTEGQQPAKMR